MMSKKTKKYVCATMMAFVMGITTVMAVTTVARANGKMQSVTLDLGTSVSGKEGRITTGVIGTGINSGVTTDVSSTNVDSTTTNASSTSSAFVSVWVPKTAQEKKLFSYVGKEKIDIQVIGGNNTIAVANSVQGIKCHEAFESVLGDYEIGRTYNIFPNNSNLKKPIYETTEESVITMKIPKAIQKEGRKYKMICVGKNGEVFEFMDSDLDDSTITFTTNHYYAYALCYMD